MRLKDDGSLDLDWREFRRPWWMKTPEMLNRLVGEYPLIEMMLHHGIPVTRESYLSLNFPDGVPDPLPAEEEEQLPEPLQLNPEAKDRPVPSSSSQAERIGDQVVEDLMRRKQLTREQAEKDLKGFL